MVDEASSGVVESSKTSDALLYMIGQSRDELGMKPFRRPDYLHLERSQQGRMGSLVLRWHEVHIREYSIIPEPIAGSWASLPPSNWSKLWTWVKEEICHF